MTPRIIRSGFVSLLAVFAFVPLSGGTATAALRAPESCCCAPAHTHIVVTGTCASCYVGVHDCTGSFLATIYPAECRNMTNATCTRSGSTSIAPERYKCGLSSTCGSSGETRCNYTQDGYGAASDVAECGALDTECSGSTTTCQ